MGWTRTPVDGTKSVGFNKTAVNANAEYTEDTLQLDHYWDEGTDESGHHKRIEMPKEASAPSLSTGMDSLVYSLDTAEPRTELFYKNGSETYQLTPSFITGSIVLASSVVFQTLTAIPANVHGNFTLFRAGVSMQQGNFCSNASTLLVTTFPYVISNGSVTTPAVSVVGTGLDFQVLTGTAGTYQYRITYRDN